MAYTILGFDGAITTSTRPHGAAGNPGFELGVSGVQVLPPSRVRYSAEPLAARGSSPPDRNVQPLRRKSHRPASSASGLLGSIARLEQPVEAFGPLSSSDHVLPP